MPSFRIRAFGIVFAAVLLAAKSEGDPIHVRFIQGSGHGFVALKTLSGTRLAVGDMTQNVHGDEVTSRLLFRFRDGSIDDDTTVFTQRGTFHLVSDHHIQRGPSFPKPIDVQIEMSTGQVTSRNGDGKVIRQHLDLPADVSNGLPPNLFMNIPPSTPETKLSYVAAGPKPRLVHFTVKPLGEQPFSIGGSKRRAIDYVVHIELGGITGMIAPMIGKQPADFHVWILSGASPAFIREEGQLYEGGPVWRIEQISPEFP